MVNSEVESPHHPGETSFSERLSHESDKISNSLKKYVITLIIVIVVLLLIVGGLSAIIILKNKTEPTKVDQPEEWKSPANSSRSNSSSTVSPTAIIQTIATEPLENSTVTQYEDRVTTNSTHVANESGAVPFEESIILPKSSRRVCDSSECKELAQQLKEHQDITVDPCQDFYKATCGNYKNSEKKHNKQARHIKFLFSEFLKKDEVSTSKSENAMRLMYRKCEEIYKSVKKDQLQNQRYNEILKTINSFGSWPILDESWDESKFDLNEMFLKMTEFGVTDFGFFNLRPSGNYSLRMEHRPKKTAVGSFEKEVANLLAMNKITPNKDLVKKDAEDIENLMKELKTFPEDYSNKKVKLSELQSHVPSINFKRIIENLLNSGKYGQEKWDKTKDNILVSSQSIFFDDIKNLETILFSTSKRTLANYLIFNFIQFMEDNPKEDCADKTQKELPLASLRVLVRNHFNRENIKLADKLMEDIRESFVTMIQDSTWLHDSTKKQALKKVTMLKKTIGYPVEFDAPGALDSFFESLELSEDDTYFQLQMKLVKLETEQLLKYPELTGYLKLINRKSSLLRANAFYSTDDNWFAVNVPYLDDPFFDSTYPEYASIAMLGRTFGHEIGHGFDLDGRLLDENGKKKNGTWTPEDSAEFVRRAQCMIDRYNNHDDPVYGKKLNGTKTLDEMLADIIGTNLAYNTYKRKDMSNEPIFEGFEDYDIDKLYFKLAASTFCAPRDTVSLQARLAGKHPTNNFRVNGILSNLKGFAETFNCPIGSPMNPEKKCELY